MSAPIDAVTLLREAVAMSQKVLESLGICGQTREFVMKNNADVLAATEPETLLEYGRQQRAEGRREALEELHPQWLAERERADRAGGGLAAHKAGGEQHNRMGDMGATYCSLGHGCAVA